MTLSTRVQAPVVDAVTQRQLEKELEKLVLDPTSSEGDFRMNVGYDEIIPLLDRGLSPNAQMSYWDVKLLHGAGWWRWDLSAIDDLLLRGADVDTASKSGETVLMYFSKLKDHGQRALYMLAKGADPFKGMAESGYNMVINAAIGGNYAVLEAGLARGVPPIATGCDPDKARSALVEGMLSEMDDRMLVLLLETGMDLDHTRGGNTPRWHTPTTAALCKSNVDRACLLIDAGANPLVEGNKGNAFEMAKEERFQGVQMQRVLDYKHLPSLDLGRDDVAYHSRLGNMWRKPLVQKSQLFAPNRHQMTPLDNPNTWRHWDAVVQTLAERGEPSVRKADLQQVNHEGKTFLRRGVECFAAGALLETLAQQGEPVSKAEMLAPSDKHGGNWFASLASWVQFDAICEALAKQGECFTKEDFLQRDGQGQALIVQAANAGKLGKVLAMLHEQDEHLDAADFDRVPELAEKVVALRETAVLFQPDHWEGKRGAQVRQLLAKLPDEARQQVPNLHQVLAGIQRQYRHQDDERAR